ncbi:sensor histidine kinase [Albidovulum sp.]|jgi:signal transduction histidine kinase|uniref:sensor histidine kinase n=1 Tax=Albidovulum sp. TaxID=1872424 RepID=UPI003048A47A
MRRSVRYWNRLSLAAQFAIAGGVVMVLSMLLIGRVVTERIAGAVVRNTAYATSQYMDSIISPLAQDLAEVDTLSPVARRALDEVFAGTALAQRVVSFKLWKPDGTVAHATDASIIGRTFAVSDNLQAALDGQVHASFEDLGDEEDRGETALGLPLLEVYSPVREAWSGRVIGVAEFYEVATQLERDLAEARRNAWLTVAGTFVAIGGVLWFIVLRGSRTIDRQQTALTAQLAELGALSAHNAALRRRVQQAAARASAMNDQALRRIGADLHDGPAQLLGFAALRLDALRAQVADEAELDAVERAVKDAIREVRSISRGLSLPDIDARTPCEIVRAVAETHAARTGTQVDVDCGVGEDAGLTPAVKICLYRFVQEGLNNAWRYAGGAGQQVALSFQAGTLRLAVSDRGPGVAAAPSAVTDADGEFSGIGLSGLRDRVESLGGTFEMRDRADAPGAEMVMELDVRGA